MARGRKLESLSDKLHAVKIPPRGLDSICGYQTDLGVQSLFSTIVNIPAPCCQWRRCLCCGSRGDLLWP
jgi:hypothetical protein